MKFDIQTSKNKNSKKQLTKQSTNQSKFKTWVQWVKE